MTARNIYCRACGAPLTPALYCNDCGVSINDLRFAGASPHNPMRLRRRPRGLVASAIASVAVAVRRRRRRARMRAAA